MTNSYLVDNQHFASLRETKTTRTIAKEKLLIICELSEALS